MNILIKSDKRRREDNRLLSLKASAELSERSTASIQYVYEWEQQFKSEMRQFMKNAWKIYLSKTLTKTNVFANSLQIPSTIQFKRESCCFTLMWVLVNFRFTFSSLFRLT